MDLLEKIQKAADQLPEIKVAVAEWESDVTLRRLSLAERSDMFERLSGENNKTNVASLLVAFSLVDEEGNKLHVKNGPDKIYQSLESGCPEVVELLYKEADKLSAVTKSSVEEIEKN